MADAGKEIAPHIRWQRNIAIGAGTDQVRRSAQIEKFRGAEGLDDLGACVGGAATIEQPRRRTMTGFIRIILPPNHAVTSRFVHARGAAGSGEADVHSQETNGDIRVAAVEDDASGFILIEPEMDEAAKESSRLRVPLADGPLDPAAQNIS